MIPAQFSGVVAKDPKLACSASAGTPVQAPVPEQLIVGGIPTEAMVALYRQGQSYAGPFAV